MHKQAIVFTFSFFLLTSLCYAQNEERLTLTTYYPAPYGTYQQLVATDKFLVCDTADVATNLGDMSDISPDAAFMGNVGIGTTSPNALLEIQGYNGTDILEVFRLDNTDGGGRGTKISFFQSNLDPPSEVGRISNFNDGSSWSMRLGSFLTPETLVIRESGNVGIGTTAPQEKLQVNGKIVAQEDFDGDNSGIFLMDYNGTQVVELKLTEDDDGIVVNAPLATGTIRLDTAGSVTPRVFIASDGKVGIGTSSPDVKLEIAGVVRVVGTDGVNAAGFYINETPVKQVGELKYVSGSGLELTTSATDPLKLLTNGVTSMIIDGNSGYVTFFRGYGSSSSIRWKTNIKPIENALKKVESLRGVYFDWKDTGKHDLGMIAEEVGEVFPELVVYEDNGKDAKTLSYSRLTAVLIEAIKELKAENDTFNRGITTLKERITALENRD